MSTQFTFLQKSLAWSVHIFTASGLLAGFMSILAINEKDWRMAMVWLVVCLFIDGIDGTFARLFKVKEVLPHIDGSTIDYVIDFATYAIIPAYFFHQIGLVAPELLLPCTFLILMVSALYYGISEMVSSDMHFVGFPVLWNVVVFYLVFVFDFSQTINALLILIFAILHFVPVKFAYPSRSQRFFYPTLVSTVIFFVSLIWFLVAYPERPLLAYGLAVYIIIYFAFLGLYETWFVSKQKKV